MATEAYVILTTNELGKIILETLFVNKVASIIDGDCYQFGFKAGHSTDLCTDTLKEEVDFIPK